MLESTVYSLGMTDIVRREDDMCQMLDPVDDLSRDPRDESAPASDGAQAMQMLDVENVHLLFLDLQMPRLGGLAVLGWVREQASPPVS